MDSIPDVGWVTKNLISLGPRGKTNTTVMLNKYSNKILLCNEYRHSAALTDLYFAQPLSENLSPAVDGNKYTHS